MNDETAILNSGLKHEFSRIFDVSVRGWIVLMVVGTVCLMGLLGIPIDKDLLALASLTVGYYFGQNSRHKEQR